ncbi:MAG: Na+/H+ antiporter NhaA [Gammaproteobacteria bacterium]|nr:Na+/H+ antiporter NhaA [Gammaproteobacteria bacterium]MDH4254482.1 Na+/H+ antiporter NhaA [Gammaproteobacteria bacterium]MDH5309086.1 Na+/H+ antiporter NhaA [Gammaproteobacteria bacterium]
MRSTIRDFLRHESASGIILMGMAALALVAANSPLHSWYDLLLQVPVEIRIGALHIDKPLLLWVNDGLMAVFFFLVGLELKREIIEGELSEPSQVVLPAVAALGGVLVPVGIYVMLNAGDPVNLQGWAIPAATDIAFALGIMSLLGDRVPVSLKVFLVSLAIFDDIGAVAIIALFYTSGLSGQALAVAAVCLALLAVLNRRGVTQVSTYLWIGLVMWVAVLKSGVHATLAGVALAMFIPMRDPDEPEHSPLSTLEHDLHHAVAFVILPVFAFANAGIPLGGIGLEQLLHPVPLGIMAGLFVGKQVGVFGFSWVAVRLGVAKLPDGANWPALYGVALLSGIGFTMSLFIASLAFENSRVGDVFDERLGIIVGSLLSGVCGYLVLRAALRAPHGRG